MPRMPAVNMRHGGMGDRNGCVSRMQGWEPGLQQYIMDLKDPSKHGGKPYTSRYIGSLVGDFHRTLLYGGIYGYCTPTRFSALPVNICPDLESIHRLSVLCSRPTSSGCL